MKYAQKLVLVPIQEWERIKEKEIPVKQVTVNIPLQKAAKEIKQKTSLVKSQKVKEGKVLNHPFQHGVGNSQNRNYVEKKLNQMIIKLSSFKRRKADYIINSIKNSKDFKWTKNKGEFQYKDKVIYKSDINKLIIHALYNSKKEPIGMKSFYKALVMIGIPRDIIINTKGRLIMKQFKYNKDDLWRPPGKLNRGKYKNES